MDKKRKKITLRECESILEFYGNGVYVVQYAHFNDRELSTAFVLVSEGETQLWQGDEPIVGEPMYRVTAWDISKDKRPGAPLGNLVGRLIADPIDILDHTEFLRHNKRAA